jgi:2-polyprenyl-6-methoxyphenol hydroxylase-like FAD-dependent oxidoreductase
VTRTALIVGAGIAGMTAAGELARAGIEVDLIEREPEPVFRGIGILLLPPAVRSMEMLGLAEACLERGFPQVDSATFLADGTLLARTPMVGLAGGDLPPAIGIARSAFGDVLRERAEDGGVRLRCGLTVDALDESGDVRYSDGSTGRYDVVVGADGLRSSVRAALFPEQPAPMFIGQSVWRVLVGMRPPDVHGQMLFLGKRTRAGFNAIREDDMYLYCLHETAEDDVPLSRAESHARLRELLDEYGGLVAEVRDRLTPDRPVHYGALYTTFVEGPWHRGNVVLIGDAAHATPPHLASGAGIAIEDAIVLARCLRDEATVPEAFDDFMNRRYERCRMVIENSRTLSRWDRDPDASGGQAAALMTDTWAALAQPI